jgi:hypothetical protein
VVGLSCYGDRSVEGDGAITINPTTPVVVVVASDMSERLRSQRSERFSRVAHLS